MLAIALRRLVVGLFTAMVSSVFIFFATEILPGDAATAILGQNATPENVAALRAQLHLDDSVWERYWHWLSGFLTGDLGNSLTTHVPVLTIIAPRLVNTLALAGYAALIGIPLGVALGVVTAAWPHSLFDRMVSIVTVFLIAIPDFAIALVFVIVLAVENHFFPAVVARPRWDQPAVMIWQLFLPMLTVVCTLLAHIVRMTRIALLDVLSTPFVEMALLKGVPKTLIILRHGLPNTIGPILSIVGLNIGYLISGVAVIEVVFSFPGLGKLMIDSISYRDVPLVQTTALIFCIVFIAFNAIADIGGRLLNPRLRYSR